MTQIPTRRRFLAAAGALAAGVTVLPARQVHGYAANERLRVALVGVGGRGEWFVDTIPRLEQVAALCDVSDDKIAAAFRHWDEFGRKFSASPHDWEKRAGVAFLRLAEKRPPVFHDFRVMLDKAGRDLDAVVVATPDHTHAVISAAALHAGKPVFCEKPLTRTIHESRALRELARQQKVPTSMGNQGTCSGAFRRALELIQNGTLGEVKEVVVWNSGGGGNRQKPPAGEQPVPPGFHWDLWLGPAAARPFHRDWLQRNLWREFGTGQLGNWGSHSANLGFMALKVHDLWLGEPGRTLKVHATTSGVNRLSFPTWETVAWDVPTRAGLPSVTITWHNGPAPGLKDRLADILKDAPEKDRGLWQFAGTLIVGTQGMIHTTGHNMWFELLPKDRFAGVQTARPEKAPDSRGPEQDWFAAIRGGPRPWANFDYASALNEFLMLGNLATQFEGPLEYDPAAMRVRGNPAADALLRSDHRPGWTL